MIVRCAFKKMVPLEQLIAHPRNPNQHPDQQVQLLAKIMNFQGIRNPIVVSNRSGFITKGHARLLAAEINQWTEFPVDSQDYESEAVEYADMVADNKIAELAESDMEMIYQDAAEILGDVSPDMLGIPDFEFPEPEVEGQCEEDEIPTQVETRVKLGDIWQLGQHRLMCGDATSIDAVEKLMSGEKVEVVFTDPPYNLQENGQLKRTNKTINKTEKFGHWDEGFNPLDVLPILDLFSEKHSHRFVCTSSYLFGVIHDWFKELGDKPNYLVWVKNNPMPSLSKKTFVQATELIVHSRKGSPEFDYPCGENLPNSFSGNVEPHKFGHPAQKPIYVIEYCIGRTKGKVLDLFGGSGSTLIACEKTKRTCYMMELDPHYTSVIIQRWIRYTGKMAYLLCEDGSRIAWDENSAVH